MSHAFRTGLFRGTQQPRIKMARMLGKHSTNLTTVRVTAVDFCICNCNPNILKFWCCYYFRGQKPRIFSSDALKKPR